MSNYFCSEPLYDNEPHQIRAEIYRSIYGQYASHAAEFSRILVKNLSEVLKFIEKRGYKHHHQRDSVYDNNHEKRILYLKNEEKKSMICVTIQNKDIEKEKINNVFWDSDDDKEYDGRRFNFISIQTLNEDELRWFKKIISESRIVEDTKNRIFMMKSTEYSGVELDSFPIDNVICDIGLNYGTSFNKVNEQVINNLKEKKSGLYIFHGPPGTGKTSYIKYLTTVVQNRKFILVPNTMVASIFSPKMVQSIYTFKDSVLVLEDAEMCVFKRDGTNNELVSGILNITDGLLKDLLNISIFVTFNSSKIDELDKALLRKGRLKTMYKFDALAKSDAQKLLRHLGKTQTVDKPMTLAEIYNVDEEVDMGGDVISDNNVPGFGPRR